MHYPPETATVFLLARLLAILLRERRALGTPEVHGYLGSFRDFAMDFRARDVGKRIRAGVGGWGRIRAGGAVERR